MRGSRGSQFGRAKYLALGDNSTMTDKMAATLKQGVRLNCEVVAVEDDGTRIEARTQDGSRYRGRHVVCALAVPPLRRILFNPGLSPLLRDAVQWTPA